jgi:hypothetical protein
MHWQERLHNLQVRSGHDNATLQNPCIAIFAGQSDSQSMWCALSQMQLSSQQCKQGNMIRLCGLGEQSASCVIGKTVCRKGMQHLEEALSIALDTHLAPVRITGITKACLTHYTSMKGLPGHAIIT